MTKYKKPAEPSAKYKKWSFPVPPVYTGNWTKKTWDNWIEKHGKAPLKK